MQKKAKKTISKIQFYVGQMNIRKRVIFANDYFPINQDIPYANISYIGADYDTF